MIVALIGPQTRYHLLQCDEVCCSALQYVAVCCSVSQCVAVCCNVMQFVAVCCSVLQCMFGINKRGMIIALIGPQTPYHLLQCDQV